MPRPETAPNGGRVVAAIAEDADRPALGPPAFAVQLRNCVDQGQCLLRIVCLWPFPRQ